MRPSRAGSSRRGIAMAAPRRAPWASSMPLRAISPSDLETGAGRTLRPGVQRSRAASSRAASSPRPLWRSTSGSAGVRRARTGGQTVAAQPGCVPTNRQTRRVAITAVTCGRGPTSQGRPNAALLGGHMCRWPFRLWTTRWAEEAARSRGRCATTAGTQSTGPCRRRSTASSCGPPRPARPYQ